MTLLAERLEDLSSKVDLDQSEVARLLDANPRTVTRWIKEGVSPRPAARERLLELLAVLEALASTMQPQAAHDWLFTPNPLLQHHKPVDLIRAGEFRRVLGAIDALADGVFV